MNVPTNVTFVSCACHHMFAKIAKGGCVPYIGLCRYTYLIKSVMYHLYHLYQEFDKKDEEESELWQGSDEQR